MNRKLLVMSCISMLSFSFVACSNKDNAQTNNIPDNNYTEATNIDNEQILFDEEIIIVDDDIATVKIKGKEKLTSDDSIGYIFSISNKCTDKIDFYVKDITVDGNKHKTVMDEYAKMPLYPDTDFSTQLTISDIKSLDDLINTSGVFCIKINNDIKEYKFEIK